MGFSTGVVIVGKPLSLTLVDLSAVLQHAVDQLGDSVHECPAAVLAAFDLEEAVLPVCCHLRGFQVFREGGDKLLSGFGRNELALAAGDVVGGYEFIYDRCPCRGSPRPFRSTSSSISEAPAVSIAWRRVSSVYCLGGRVQWSVTFVFTDRNWAP